MTTVYVVLGTIFGFILSRSGAADYDFIQGMFLFTNLQLYGIIGAAVLVGMVVIYDMPCAPAERLKLCGALDALAFELGLTNNRKSFSVENLNPNYVRAEP